MSHDDDPGGRYNDTHRAFLQALFSRQTLTYEEAKPLLAAIQTAATPARPTLVEDVTPEDFEGYIHAINANLSGFDFEIRTTLHQATRQQVYALVNTTSDALTQMATLQSADEIAFVKRLLDAMFEVNNTVTAEVMAVKGTQALRYAKLPNDPNRGESGSGTQVGVNSSLTMAQAEKVLQILVAEDWFELSAAGYYSLTPRALMELRGWLMDTYNDDDDDDDDSHIKIKLCQACKDIVTIGQRCPDEQCQARLHNHCVRTMFRAQGGQERCPMCKVGWNDPPPVGEKAARHGARRPGGPSIGERVSDD